MAGGPVYIGSVKSFNPERGWGHVECVETFQIYGKDIFLLKSQLRDAQSVSRGTQVSFRITDNGRGPEAVDVTIIDASSTSRPQVQSNGGGSQPYTGVIKSFNPKSGWGHITCPQTEALYGKDIFFMKSQLPGGTISKGTTVTFSVGEGLKGPEGNDIQPVGGSTALANLGAMPALPSTLAEWRGGAGEPYYGTIKSFNDEKGWGHITCSQTQSIYGKDMFVMRTALGGTTVRPGDSVQFQVIQGQKGPEATSVKVVARVGSDGSYTGTIKQFQEEKGWGFIACDETRALYGKDIFIHKNNLQGHTPSEGESVQFSVQISNQGRPEAYNMSFGNGGAGRYAAVRKTPWSKGRPTPF